MWGDTSKSFCAAVTLYNNGDVATTGFICLDDALHQEYLVGSDNDTLFLDIATETSSFNNRPRILLQVYSKTADSIYLSLKATDGTINAWTGIVKNTTGYYAPFTSNSKPWAVSGDVASTIGDMASTRSAITVGAYASKVRYTNLAGQNIDYSFYLAKGNRAPFTSHGPTANGAYMKPDISGPGLTLASAVNSYDLSMVPGGGSEDALVAYFLSPQNNRDYYYGQLMGTSMSSPAVAGIIALMLQADPNLTPDATRQILQETAIKDAFTTQNPNGNIWGAGKVNAYKAVMRAAGVSSIRQVKNKASLSFKVYPNPTQKDLNIACNAKAGELVQLTISNMAGMPVWVDSWKALGTEEIKEMTVKLSGGNYLVRLRAGDKEGTQKLTIY